MSSEICMRFVAMMFGHSCDRPCSILRSSRLMSHTLSALRLRLLHQKICLVRYLPSFVIASLTLVAKPVTKVTVFHVGSPSPSPPLPPPPPLIMRTADIALHGHKHLMSCTGVNNFTEYGYYYQTQAMATPSPLPSSNPDPLLIHWTKAKQNPIISSVPEGGNHSQFRDPTTMWQQVWHNPAVLLWHNLTVDQWHNLNMNLLQCIVHA